MLDFCKKFAGELSELSASQVDRRRKYIYKLVRERIEEEGIPLTPHNMNIVLLEPEIPQNTGSIARTCRYLTNSHTE